MTQTWRYSNAQLCLSWILNKYSHIIPIAGTRREKYLIENAKATNIKLTAEQIKALDDLFDPQNIAGERYPNVGWGGIEN